MASFLECRAELGIGLAVNYLPNAVRRSEYKALHPISLNCSCANVDRRTEVSPAKLIIRDVTANFDLEIEKRFASIMSTLLKQPGKHLWNTVGLVKQD